MEKKLVVYAGLALFIYAGVAATHVPDGEKPAWRNLKIIPKSTEEDQMDRIMGKFNKSLSVTCNFCHARTKPGIFPVRADFASDEKPEKLMARKMMRMTDKLSRKYFNFQNKYDFNSLTTAVISCRTCHQGQVRPSNYRIYAPAGDK
ncbi:MAG TPA: c-type cytochrome [Puia sp.]|nr:c-type cytochrome [Puia sp.]